MQACSYWEHSRGIIFSSEILIRRCPISFLFLFLHNRFIYLFFFYLSLVDPSILILWAFSIKCSVHGAKLHIGMLWKGIPLEGLHSMDFYLRWVTMWSVSLHIHSVSFMCVYTAELLLLSPLNPTIVNPYLS